MKVAVPTGDIADMYNTGLATSYITRIATEKPRFMIDIGGGYTYLPRETVKYEHIELFSLFAGPQFSIETGEFFFGKGMRLYLLPAITWSFNKGIHHLFGVDLGTGFLIPIAENVGFDIGVRYGLTNIIGKKDEEKGINIVSSSIRIIFNFGS